MTSATRRALDRLLALYPDAELTAIDRQEPPPIEVFEAAVRGGARRRAACWPQAPGPWVLVTLGDEEFAIWKATGDVYAVDEQGAVVEGPLIPGISDSQESNNERNQMATEKTTTVAVTGVASDEDFEARATIETTEDPWSAAARMANQIFTIFEAAFHVKPSSVGVSLDEATAPYPFQDDNGSTVIGPECFADRDHRVISWRGTNYYRNFHSEAEAN